MDTTLFCYRLHTFLLSQRNFSLTIVMNTSFYENKKGPWIIFPPVNPSQSDGDESGNSDDNIGKDDLEAPLSNFHGLDIEQSINCDAALDGEDTISTEIPSISNGNYQPHSKRVFRWRKKDIPPLPQQPIPAFSAQDDTVLGYFKKFFDDDLINLIVEQSNIYAIDQSGLPLNTNIKEIEQFLGALLFMGVLTLPAYTDYWALSTAFPAITDIFSLKRFQKLRRYLHFAENSAAATSGDRLFKIRPVLDSIVHKCRRIEQESDFSIDELMVPYKGTRAGNLRQYIQNKPHKWGFKIFVRAGVSGIIYDFLPYIGKGMLQNLSGKEMCFGVGGQVVVALCRTIPQGNLYIFSPIRMFNI